MTSRRCIPLAAAFLLATCGGEAPVPHRVLEPTSDLLRARFDADSGKIRALFLASPT